MATPTPGPASKRPSGGVSTPSHMNHSSPPRSVPSPVTARHAAVKTPVNHPTTGSSQGSKTLGSTPMVQNLSQNGHTISPSANMLSFNTPNGLGIEGITPAALNLPTPVLAGTQMMPTMSELGLGAGGGKRNEDEERRMRMRRVLKAIGKPKGRVSEEGITRISRRYGFANDIDAEKLSPEEKERKVGNRQFSTAGNTILVEVELKHQVPQTVQVSYSVQSKALEEQAEKAGKVLLSDLKALEKGCAYATLDRFAANMERMARLDRLSARGINCFEALAGIYTCLRRLFEQEMLIVRDDTKSQPGGEAKVEQEVVCHRSGRPVIHHNQMLGLAIEYWSPSLPTDQKTDHGMDNEGQNHDQPSATDSIQTPSLFIEVEAALSGLYPSLRVSESWLPDPLHLPEEGSMEGIPWQDPPPTFITAGAGNDTGVAEGHSKLPDLRYMATLNPPVVMPYQVAVNVLGALGVSQVPIVPMPPAQCAALLLGQATAPTAAQQTSPFTFSRTREVLSQKYGRETTMLHDCTVESSKFDYGFMLEVLPFSHPRQLVELLPTLRQWVCVSQLLKGMFSEGTNTSAIENTNGQTNGTPLDDDDDSLDALINPPDTAEDTKKVLISVSLTTSPTPTITVAFPTSRSIDGLIELSIDVLPNAHLSISSTDEALSKDTVKLQKLGKALLLCGDLGVWIEWLRTSIIV